MPRYKLTYFDASVSRGEECRLALHVAGVDFEDERLPTSAWRERKATTPFGALPVLEVEGRGVISQSNAILTFIGRTHGLHPADPWEAARHEAILSSAEDLRHRISPTQRIKDPDEKRRAREELASGDIPTWSGNVERQLGDGPFVVGERIHVVDIKLYVLMGWFVRGGLDHVPNDVLAKNSRLMRVYEAVKQHPRVVDWQNRHPR